MEPRFKVTSTTRLDDGTKRYRVIDTVEGGPPNTHGVFKLEADAQVVCSALNENLIQSITSIPESSPSAFQVGSAEAYSSGSSAAAF